VIGGTWLERSIAEYQEDPDYIAELLVLGLNEQVVSRMQAMGLRRSDLAQRMGVSKAYITRVLRGNPNLTLRSIAAVSLALDTRPIIGLQPCRTVNELVYWRHFQLPEVIASYERQEEDEAATAGALAA
jgi:transcriptional regulator with XRE-family HTH domain